MNSWVCASTPTVTRTSTSCTTPASPAMASSRSISVIESSTTWPTPALTAAVSSSTDLLLPCKAIRSGGKLACSATASSPPLQTSSDRPSSSIQRATSLHRNALAGVADVVAAAERLGDLAAARPEVVLVDDEQRRAVLLRRATAAGRRRWRRLPSSPRTVLRGHTFGASASSSRRADGRGGTPAWWISSACRGPAGWAFTCAPVR